MAGVQQRHVFFRDDGVFSSPNASTLPPLPTPPSSHSTDWAEFMDPRDVRQPLWSSNSYPHLVYVPATICFDGPLFLHLAYNTCTMPLEPDMAMWRLSSLVAATWKNLEDTLLFVADRILNKSGVLFPLSFTSCPMPRTKEYL